jgi:hypothetical protein
MSKRDHVNKLVQELRDQIRDRAARMSSVSEPEVRQWVEHGGPDELRDIREVMADLWRDGLVELTRTESGDLRDGITEFGRSVREADDQKDEPVCASCSESRGVIRQFLITNTETGSHLVQWMHEDCFAALPLVQ